MDPFEVADRYSAGCADIHGRVRYRRRTQAMNACIHDEASSQEARLALRLEASFRLALLPVLRYSNYSISVVADRYRGRIRLQSILAVYKSSVWWYSSAFWISLWHLQFNPDSILILPFLPCSFPFFRRVLLNHHRSLYQGWWLYCYYLFWYTEPPCIYLYPCINSLPILFRRWSLIHYRLTFHIITLSIHCCINILIIDICFYSSPDSWFNLVDPDNYFIRGI